jgi:hypothetical protein
MRTVLFLEWTLEQPADVTEAALKSVARSLELITGFVGARALRSTQDPRVHLLETTWDGEPPALELTTLGLEAVKARSWAFEVLEDDKIPFWQRFQK